MAQPAEGKPSSDLTARPPRRRVRRTHDFDNRSFRLNFEVAAVVYDEPFAREVEAMLETDLASCPAIDPASFAERPWHWTFGVRLARLMAPVL